MKHLIIFTLLISLSLNCLFVYDYYKSNAWDPQPSRTMLGIDSLIEIENRTKADICYVHIIDSELKDWHQVSTIRPDFRLIPRQVQPFGAAEGKVLINVGDCNGTSVAGAIFNIKYGEQRRVVLRYRDE